MSDFDVSIFIRSRNESSLIGECLRAILEQKHSYRVEILVLDSESTDGTANMARELGARVLSIPKSLFTYSSALNAGVQLAKGRYFVSLSAHCIPANSDWLENLLLPLSDSACAATFSRQIPWSDVSIPEALQISYAFPLKERVITADTWKLSLSEGTQPFEAAIHSNTTAAYKVDILKKFPFKKIPYAEDRLITGELLAAGYSIRYASESTAYHSHYPRFQDFRTVAKLATISRFIINRAFGSEYSSPKKLSLLCSQLKIPAYVLLLSLTIFIPLLPGRKNRLRELHWRIASLGTTIGKSEGIRSFLHISADKIALEVDSPLNILKHVENASSYEYP